LAWAAYSTQSVVSVKCFFKLSFRFEGFNLKPSN
jgi:hypothetical protein